MIEINIFNIIIGIVLIIQIFFAGYMYDGTEMKTITRKIIFTFGIAFIGIFMITYALGYKEYKIGRAHV